MVLLTILAILLAVVVMAVSAFIGVIGGATLLIAGDIIVFVAIVALIIKLFKKK